MNFLSIFKRKPKWEYGYCNGVRTRRHIKNGNLQFVLWKSGEQKNTEDTWVDADPCWSRAFVKDGEK